MQAARRHRTATHTLVGCCLPQSWPVTTLDAAALEDPAPAAPTEELHVGLRHPARAGTSAAIDEIRISRRLQKRLLGKPLALCILSSHVILGKALKPGAGTGHAHHQKSNQGGHRRPATGAADKPIVVGDRSGVLPSSRAIGNGEFGKVTGQKRDFRKFNSGAEVIGAIPGGDVPVGYVGPCPLAGMACSAVTAKAVPRASTLACKVD